MRTAFTLAAIVLLFGASQCGARTVYEYQDGGRTCCKTTVSAGTGEASVNVSILTDQAGLFERNYPAVVTEYVSNPGDAGGLKKIDVELSASNPVETADVVEIGAGFFDAFTTDKFAHSVAPSECCERLDLRIRNDAATYQGDYGPVHFGVKLRKDYRALRPLPQEMTVQILVHTDRGLFRETRRVSLTSHKSEGGVPFRFH